MTRTTIIPPTLPNGALVVIAIDPVPSVAYLEDETISRDAAEMGRTTCLAVVRHRCPKREYGLAGAEQKYLFHLVGRSSAFVSGRVAISGPVPHNWKATERAARSSDHNSLHCDMHNGKHPGEKRVDSREDDSEIQPPAPRRKVNWFTGKVDEPPDYRAQGLTASSILWDGAYVDSLGMFVASISGIDDSPLHDEEAIPRLTGSWEAWLDSFVAREASHVHTLYTAARRAYFTAEQELPMNWDAGDPHVGEFDRDAQLDYEPDFYAKYMSSTNQEDAILEMVYEHERFDRDAARLCVRVSGLTEDCQAGSPDDFLGAIRSLRQMILEHRPYVSPEEPPKEYSRFNWPRYSDTTAARHIPEPIGVPALHKGSGDFAGRSSATPAPTILGTKSARRERIRGVRFSNEVEELPGITQEEKCANSDDQPSCTMLGNAMSWCHDL